MSEDTTADRVIAAAIRTARAEALREFAANMAARRDLSAALSAYPLSSGPEDGTVTYDQVVRMLTNRADQIERGDS